MVDEKLFLINSLKVADILLSSGVGGVSGAIKASTWSKFSHSALYIGNNEVIEAIDVGVKQRNLQESTIHSSLVSVYRKSDLSIEKGCLIVQYAKQQLDKPYDVNGAVGAGSSSNAGNIIGLTLGRGIVGNIVRAYTKYSDAKNQQDPEAAFFCSELVTLAYKSAGIILGTEGASTTPADLSKVSALEYLGDIRRTSK